MTDIDPPGLGIAETDVCLCLCLWSYFVQRGYVMLFYVA